MLLSLIFSQNKFSLSLSIFQSEQQHQQEIRKTTDSSSTIPDKSVDEEFIAELRKLINKYIQRTTRPFPLRYFIDLSHQ